MSSIPGDTRPTGPAGRTRKGYKWYTITRLRDDKIVCEMEYQDRVVARGFWLNVTNPPVCMGYYWYNPMRPDKRALPAPPPPRACPPKEPPVIYLMPTNGGVMPTKPNDSLLDSEPNEK